MTRYLMDWRRITRFRKRTKEYGKLELLSTSCQPEAESRRRDRKPRELKTSASVDWDKQTCGDRCAGCHATAVNTKSRAFSARSLDCLACQ